MDQVVGHHSGFFVGGVFELGWVGDVAQCPDSLGRGSQVLIGGYVSVVVHRYAASGHFQSVTVGLSAGRHQELLCLEDGAVV